MAESRSNSRPRGDLLIELGRDVAMPPHRQIAASIRDGIRSGPITEGIDMLASAIDEVRFA